MQIKTVDAIMTFLLRERSIYAPIKTVNDEYYVYLLRKRKYVPNLHELDATN